ncbi:hypothetical protein EJ071_37880 [Mesorhizobium sp. M1B.F.Ca.ET.045.04.1.1]|nr:hypothetical protein EJ071_37880 [Mesorhizobium sp. M1B.F.Ca.ET.045.04.1.1]
MVSIIGRGLDTLPGDKPLPLLRVIHISRARHPHKITVFGHPDVAGIDWVAILIAAAIIMKNRVSLASVPIVGVRIAGQDKPHQCNSGLELRHELAFAFD